MDTTIHHLKEKQVKLIVWMISYLGIVLKFAWENTNSKKDFTYTNVSLGHKSCIDHILVDNCIFDRIIDNYVIYDGANPSNHNVLYLSIKNFRDMLYAKYDWLGADHHQLSMPPISKDCSNTFLERSFIYAAPCEWNKLSECIRTSTFDSFKKSVKTMLFTQQYGCWVKIVDILLLFRL